jgi:hypothetical protein
VNLSDLAVISKDEISVKAKTLSAQDVAFLVDELNEKDDKLRYNAFLLLHAHSAFASSVYSYWDVLAQKLDNDNSYQRSLGVMLMAENIRWDSEGKFAASLSKYLACCSDEKFITARQTMQALTKIAGITKAYNKAIAKHISSLDLSKYKDNQQSLLKKDIAALQKEL